MSVIHGVTSSNDTLPVAIDGQRNMSTISAGKTLLAAALATVTTAGTRVQLPSLVCTEVTIIAKRTNTGYIYAGLSDVSATVYGIELGAKDSFTFTVNNANQIYIDASVSGEGISYVAV